VRYACDPPDRKRKEVDVSGVEMPIDTPLSHGVNQYTSRSVPGAVDDIGSATNTATVTVNDQATYRKTNYYRIQLALTNASSAVWQSVTNLAVLNQGTTDVMLSGLTNNVFLPQTPESFTYDADGNLASDGRWTYTWDAENRLLSLTSLTGAPAASKLSLSFVYDARGRRIQKTVSTWNGSTYASPSTLDFVYDGWNLIASLTNSSTLNEAFTWGLDLSGSVQGSPRESGTSLTGGAGGVGGLLEVTYCGSATTNAFAAFDGNGNASALVSAASGAVLAQYEYGPFGEVIRASGLMAKANPFRFSTKYQDDETDLLYYGHRYLNTSTGGWLGRDLIAEKGGLNLYTFVHNSPISDIDLFGFCGAGTGTCGPDVTSSLRLTLDNIESTYNNQWSLFQKWRVCIDLYQPLTAGIAWDIIPLKDIGFGPQTTPCDRTVTFKNKCYYGGAVNYAMWGKVNKLCFDTFNLSGDPAGPWSLPMAVGFAAAWKLHYLRFGNEEEEALGFTAYGYTGKLVSPSVNNCVPNSITMKGVLPWRWLPMQDPDNL
jgi:RHS repeat-associated protein